MYSPPLNIFVYDKRFGYSPLIGSHSIISLKQFEQAVDGKQLHSQYNTLIYIIVVIIIIYYRNMSSCYES